MINEATSAVSEPTSRTLQCRPPIVAHKTHLYCLRLSPHPDIGPSNLDPPLQETGTLVPRLSSPGALSKSPGKERRSSASLGMRTIGRKKRDSDYFAVTDFCTVKSAQAKTRSEVNQLMTRELRLRDGCKNLLRFAWSRSFPISFSRRTGVRTFFVRLRVSFKLNVGNQ